MIVRSFNLYINSPGGGVLAGISVYDAIQFVTPDVHTIDMGIAASMASFILMGRYIYKTCGLSSRKSNASSAS